MKITKQSVDALVPKKRADGQVIDGYIWDKKLSGFGCKVMPTGRKVFVVQYRLGGRKGKTRRVMLGVFGAITADQARKKAIGIIGRISQGEDPAEEKRERKKKLIAKTFAEAVETYLVQNGKDKRSWPEVRRLIEHDAIMMLGPKPLESISRVTIAELIDDVARRSPAVANALFRALRPMFRWCFERGFVAHNPIQGLSPPPAPKSRKRVLTEAEICVLWAATNQIEWPFGPLYQLLLLTGQRRSEVAEITTSEIDFEHKLWRIPASRTKNGLDHTVDLSPLAINVLQSAKAFASDRASFMFTTTGSTPVSGFSKIKPKIDAIMRSQLIDLPDWRTHDLRRTVSTLMGEKLDIDQGVIERCLNHVSGTQGGLMGVYQRQTYREKRRAAFLAWGEFIETLCCEG